MGAPVLISEYRKLKNNTRYTMVRGGRGSAKSFHVPIYWLFFILNNDNEVVLYTRYTMDSAKTSIIPEIKEKIDMYNLNQFFKITNDSIVSIKNGSKIIFKGIKTSSGNQTAKLKSTAGLTAWVLDEAEEMVNQKEFETIDDSIRKKGGSNKVMLIFNSVDVEHWIYKEFYMSGEREDTTYILTSYLHNIKNLDKTFIDKANRIKREDPDYYRVNYLADFSHPRDLIFQKGYEIFEDEPEGYDWTGVGLDWGFSDHPCAAVRAWGVQDRIYLKLRVYQIGLTNQELAQALQDDKDTFVVCDSAEQKSVLELRRANINAIPAKKGPGSVREGIKYLQNSRIFIHRESVELQKEWKKYTWKKLASGVYARDEKGFRVPVKQFDDGIDASRYIAMFFNGRV